MNSLPHCSAGFSERTEAWPYSRQMKEKVEGANKRGKMEEWKKKQRGRKEDGESKRKRNRMGR